MYFWFVSAGCTYLLIIILSKNLCLSVLYFAVKTLVAVNFRYKPAMYVNLENKNKEN